MRNLRLEICYDGTRYRGWQRLAGQEERTVQGKLELTLSRILGEPIEISGSGRTDAGVHARGQVASFHCRSDMACAEILEALRRYLPEDIGIYSCREVSPGFHARLNASRKTYRYRLWNSELPCVFERRYVTVLPEKLDLPAMERAARILEGEHDFSAFCSNPRMKKSTVRRIDAIRIERAGPELRMDVTGNGFLQGMVRILAGTLVEVGMGLREPEETAQLFGAPRAMAGRRMPPQGLCLMEVMYE